MADTIKVAGLNQFVRALRKLDSDLPKMVRVANNAVAQIVLDYAIPRVPRRSGRAVSTLKARSTGKLVRVQAGGTKAPYYPWLDFGGAVGRKKSVKRPFYTDGRYLYVALRANRDKVQAALETSLVDTARAAGLEVS